MRGVASSAARRAANYSPRNQGSFHQSQQLPTKPNTEPHKKTYWDARRVLHGAVPTLRAGREPDAYGQLKSTPVPTGAWKSIALDFIVRLNPTGFGPKAAQIEHAEGNRKVPGEGGNRHLRYFFGIWIPLAKPKLSPSRQRAPITYSFVQIVDILYNQLVDDQETDGEWPLTGLRGRFVGIVVVK
ncbi:hypothetical protein GMDG_08736 [Pseudogymnoascus destructans 20631-21]|uniref:Uncharacterized protein n=1 Tax=Pseudogymnoascus destructans (strain ATCC MYA-4855 / 20631-21) TaxID=658429 RepID=L8GDV4_PSED2|nr:hypothetical protein GMDG_08736 [Pseudogymnoascus destructans 20631-21]